MIVGLLVFAIVIGSIVALMLIDVIIDRID